MPTPSPVKGGKLPKARVSYAEHTLKRPLESANTLRFGDSTAYDHCIPVAILPTRTKAQAARICKAHNMMNDERIEKAAIRIAEGRNWVGCWKRDCPEAAKESYRKDARNALGLGGEATR